MSDYRKNTTTDSDEEPCAQENPTYSDWEEPDYMSLAAQYGSTRMMDIGDPVGGKQQTLDQEYQAYVTGAHSPKNQDPLCFWEVCGILMVLEHH